MYYDNKIWIGDADGEKICILPKMANRHGLIAGATGTGKTITLKVLAESFSDAGVPVFLADIKGDLSGMCRPGEDSADMQARIDRCIQRAEPGEDTNRKKIQANIRRIDKARAQTRDIISGSKWGLRGTYHLIVNTTDWNIKMLTPAVAEFAKRWFEKEGR